MLRRQRPNQRIVLAGLLGGWELNAVGDKAHLRPLLSDKIPNLNQLLGKDLRGRDQRLQRVGWRRHHLGVNLIEDRLEIVSLLQRAMRGIGLHFRILQLLAEHAQRAVRLTQRLTLGHIILRDADRIDAVHHRAQTSVHRLAHLLRVTVDHRVVRDKRPKLFFLIGGQRRQTFTATHRRILQEVDKRFALIAFFIKTPTQANHHQ